MKSSSSRSLNVFTAYTMPLVSWAKTDCTSACVCACVGVCVCVSVSVCVCACARARVHNPAAETGFLRRVNDKLFIDARPVNRRLLCVFPFSVEEGACRGRRRLKCPPCSGVVQWTPSSSWQVPWHQTTIGCHVRNTVEKRRQDFLRRFIFPLVLPASGIAFASEVWLQYATRWLCKTLSNNERQCSHALDQFSLFGRAWGAHGRTIAFLCWNLTQILAVMIAIDHRAPPHFDKLDSSQCELKLNDVGGHRIYKLNANTLPRCREMAVWQWHGARAKSAAETPCYSLDERTRETMVAYHSLKQTVKQRWVSWLCQWRRGWQKWDINPCQLNGSA